jgi:hypothetical protein
VGEVMNIIELAKQAGLVRVGDFGMKRWEGPRSDSINDQDLEKFAELIVQECLQVINQSNGVGDDDVIKISKDVEQHFGVEE